MTEKMKVIFFKSEQLVTFHASICIGIGEKDIKILSVRSDVNQQCLVGNGLVKVKILN